MSQTKATPNQPRLQVYHQSYTPAPTMDGLNSSLDCDSSLFDSPQFPSHPSASLTETLESKFGHSLTHQMSVAYRLPRLMFYNLQAQLLECRPNQPVIVKTDLDFTCARVLVDQLKADERELSTHSERLGRLLEQVMKEEENEQHQQNEDKVRYKILFMWECTQWMGI